MFEPAKTVVLQQTSYLDDMAALNRNALYAMIVILLAGAAVFGAIMAESHQRYLDEVNQESMVRK